MPDPLPTFKYHPDPVQSGCVVASKKKCLCCKKSRGYIYTGPVYCEDDLEGKLCPWCIADGSANKKHEAEFVSVDCLPDGIPDDLINELTTRNPGFASWQDNPWPVCCNDAVAFLEPVGLAELRERYPELEFNILGNIIYDLKHTGTAAHRMLDALSRDGSPTGYIYRCTHCQNFKTQVDGMMGS